MYQNTFLHKIILRMYTYQKCFPGMFIHGVFNAKRHYFKPCILLYFWIPLLIWYLPGDMKNTYYNLWLWNRWLYSRKTLFDIDFLIVHFRNLYKLLSFTESYINVIIIRSSFDFIKNIIVIVHKTFAIFHIAWAFSLF